MKIKFTQKESKIQTEILRYLNSLRDASFIKKDQGAYSKIGVGDLVGHVCGLYLEIETKRPTEQLKKIQEKRKTEILDSGGMYIRATNLLEIKKLVERIRLIMI